MSPVPDVDDVAGKAPVHDQDRVDANLVVRPGIARGEHPGCRDHPAQRAFFHRPGGRCAVGAPLDLDKGDGAAAPRDQVYLSPRAAHPRSAEHTSELQSLMRISYAVFVLKKKRYKQTIIQ